MWKLLSKPQKPQNFQWQKILYSRFDNPKDIFSFYSVYCGNRGSLKILAIEKWLLFQELGEIWPHHSFLIKEQADKKDKNINKKMTAWKEWKMKLVITMTID